MRPNARKLSRNSYDIGPATVVEKRYWFILISDSNLTSNAEQYVKMASKLKLAYIKTAPAVAFKGRCITNGRHSAQPCPATPAR